MSQRTGVRIFLLPCILLLMAAFLVGCVPDGAEEDRILLLLCTERNLRDCHLSTANVGGSLEKWDVEHIPPEIGNDNLRSFMVVCGVPAAALVYQHHHFGGNLGVYHCTPGETLEVADLGALSGQVSSMIFTGDEYYTEGAIALEHTGIDLSQAIGEFRDGVKEGLEADEDVEAVDLWRTQIWWTDLLNVMARPEFDGDTVYTGPNAESWRSQQIVGFYQRVNLDPEWWIYNYEVRLKWFLHPEIQGSDRFVSFQPWAWTLWVEGGVLTDKILDGIAGTMWDSSDDLNTLLVEAIVAEGDEALEGVGELLVRDLTSIGWTIFDPRPCNSRSGHSCDHSRSIPPTLILHH